MTDLLAQLSAGALEELWRRGRALEVLLDDAGPTGGQRAWLERFHATPPLSSTVWNIGRQRGKTFAAIADDIDFCAKTPEAIVRYCAKTKESAANIVLPAWNTITATMPRDMRPVASASDETEWTFPRTGAVFKLFGTDAKSFDKGRGPRTHRQKFDEAGFYQDLAGVEAALLPSLQTTGGKALYLSSPAESVGHPYTARIRAAQAAGRYEHDTFWNNPRVDHEAVIRFECERLGMTRAQLLASTYFRREYLAEIVTDDSRAAMPSWTVELATQVVGDWQRPTHWDGYQALDPGKTGDPHAWLGAYYDPATAILTIEDELELRSVATTIGTWVGEIKTRERALYGADRWDGTLLGAEDWLKEFGKLPEFLQRSINTNAPRQPYMRIGDNEGLVLNTLANDHGLAVFPTDKHDKHLAVDACNAMLGKGRIRIHRRCVRLIEQLYATVWNRTRSEWERTDKDHGDLIDCLVYLVRMVRWNRDCRPKPPPHMMPASTEPTGLEKWAKLIGRGR